MLNWKLDRWQKRQYSHVHQHASLTCISTYVYDSPNFKSQRNFDTNTKNVGILSIELISKNSKSTVLSIIYRLPDGDFKAFKIFLKELYSIVLKSDDFSMLQVNSNLAFLIITKNKNKNYEISRFNIWIRFVFSHHQINSSYKNCYGCHRSYYYKLTITWVNWYNNK